MTEQETRTKELLGARPNSKSSYADVQALQNQIQAINYERAQNVALARQDTQANAQIAQVANDAGQALLVGSGGVTAGTGATLAKYGMPLKQTTTKQETKVVKQGPTNIHITNNNITTNNNGGIPQGHEIAFKQPQQAEAQAQQGRFKQWVSGVFSRQKEENLKREKQYERREWSLSKQVNKLVRKMEDTGRTVIDNLNPQKFASSVSSQLKTLLFLFGIKFLASNFTKVLEVTHKVSNFLEKSLDWFGVTEKGRKLNQQGSAGSFRGDLYYFFTGQYPKNGETIMGLFSKLFNDLVKHISTWFEWQMERRGIAIKQIKFPKLDLSASQNDTGSSMFNTLLAGLGDVLSKTFSGVTTYLGDILTAIVDPEAGIRKSAESNIKQEGLKSSYSAMNRREEPSAFENSKFNSDVNNGDYSLVTTSDSGKRKYSLNMNAIDSSGNLITGEGSAGAQISQGRDILGAYNDAKDYGVINTGRLLGGLQRLYESSRSQGSVVVDAEFMQKMFGTTSVRGVEPVRMKFVEADMTDREKALERSYSEQKYGAIGWLSGMGLGALNGVSEYAMGGLTSKYAGKAVKGTGKAVARGVGAVANQTGNLATKAAARVIGKTAVKAGMKLIPGVGSVDAAGGAIKGLYDGVRAEIEQNDKKYVLVPENDPRPAAISGTHVFYSVKPEALEQLAQSKFKAESFDRKNYEVLLSSTEDSLISAGGGINRVNKQWNLVGKDSELFEKQRDYDIEQYKEQFKHLRSTDEYYTNKLKNDAWSRDMETVTTNLKIGYNKAVDFVNEGIDRVNSAFGSVKTIPLSKGQQTKNSNYIMNRLMQEGGLTKEQASAVVGNLLAESSLNPTSYNPNDNGGPSGGIAQWHDTTPGKGRLSNLKAYASSKGKPWTDLVTQVDFLLYQDQESLRALQEIKRAGSGVSDSTFLWGYYAEKFKGYKDRNHSEYRKRHSFALGALQGYSGVTYTDAQMSFPLASTDIEDQRQMSSPYYAGASDREGIAVQVCGTAGQGKSAIREWLWGGKDYPTIYTGQGSPAERRMSTLIVTVSVPCRDKNGRKYIHNIRIHKYLAQDLQNIFKEIFQTTPFIITPGDTGGYCYRAANLGKGSNPGKKLSNHAFGSAVDINWKVNGLGIKSGSDDNMRLRTTNHPVVKIFNYHGWTWGGIWKTPDPMHFEFTNGSKNIQEGLIGDKQKELVEGTISSSTTLKDLSIASSTYNGAIIEGDNQFKITNQWGTETKISLSSASGVEYSKSHADLYVDYMNSGNAVTTYTNYEGTNSGKGNESCAIVGDSWSVGLKPYFPKQFGSEGIQIINPKDKKGDGKRALQSALQNNSNPIVLIIGLNSISLSANKLTEQYTELANMAKDGGKKLFICTYPFVDGGKREDLNKEIPKINKVIASVCSRGLANLIDIEPYRYQSNYGKDGYHLDSQGLKMLADEIKDKMAGKKGTYTDNSIKTSGGYVNYSGNLEEGYSGEVNEEFYGTGGSIPYIPESVKAEDITNDSDLMRVVEEAGEIWKAYDGKMIASNGQGYYKSLAEFATDFVKLNSEDRADIISRAKGYTNGVDIWNKLDRNYDLKENLKNRDLLFTGKNSYLKDEASFRDWYSNLTEKQRKGAEYFLDYRNSLSSDDQFNSWYEMAKNNKEFSKFLFNDPRFKTRIDTTSGAGYGARQMRYATFDKNKVREWYDNVINGNERAQKDEKIISSVLYRDDFKNISDEIKSLESRIGSRYISRRERENLIYELEFKKHKLNSLGSRRRLYNSKVKIGDTLDKKGLYLLNEHENKEKLDRLSELAFLKKNLKSKYDKLILRAWNRGDTTSMEEWEKMYNDELQSMIDEENRIQDELDKLAEKVGGNVAELRKKRQQMQQYLLDGEEGVKKTFDEALNSGKSFLDAINEAVLKYGEEVALELARSKKGFEDTTLSDLNKNYRLSEDPILNNMLDRKLDEYDPNHTSDVDLASMGLNLSSRIERDERFGKTVSAETKKKADLLSSWEGRQVFKDLSKIRNYVSSEVSKGRYHFSGVSKDFRGIKMTKEETFADIAKDFNMSSKELSRLIASSSNINAEGLAAVVKKIDALGSKFKGGESIVFQSPTPATTSFTK